MARLTDKRYRVSTLGFLRSCIAAYRGPSALIKELIQNADDAPAERMEFDIHRDSLIVRNSGVFSDADFEAIATIASGGKRDNADATGTWGTGFTSVFQITDHPEIRSAGTHIIIDPATEEIEESPDDHNVVGTEFRFPWRSADSKLLTKIDVEPWGRQRIDELITTLVREALQNLLFLRNLREIVVFDNRNQRPTELLRVNKGFGADPSVPGRASRQLTISMRRQEHVAWQGIWYVAQKTVSEPHTRLIDSEVIVKRGEVQVAFGDLPPWLPVPGLLYNILPTGIETGFRFYINGDFYPTGDRSGILIGNDVQGHWNHDLIKGIASLVAESLSLFKHGTASPEAFYELLPTSCSSAYGFLQPIVDRVREAAKKGPYARTVSGWERPTIARRPVDGRVEKLVAHAEQDLPFVTPLGLSPDVKEYLGVRDYSLADLARSLRDLIRRDGTLLDSAPSLINTRERLDALLREFDRGIASEANADRTGQRDSPLAAAVRGLPLALDDEGRLRRLNNDARCVARVTDTLRSLVPEASILLIDQQFERDHQRFLERFLRPLTVREVVAALRKAGASWVGRPLEEADPAIGSWNQMQLLWRELERAYLDCDLSEIDLRDAPILVDESGAIRLAGAGETVVADADVRPLLDPTGLSYLHTNLASHEEYAPVWRLAGVERLGPSELVGRLRAWLPKRQPLQDAHPSVNDVARLRAWYAYFAKHADDLSPSVRDTLRTIPFVLTNDGEIAPANADGRSHLSLPPEGAIDLDRDLLALLPDIAYLVDARVVDDDTRRFLTGILGIEPLTRRRFITQHVLANYETIPESGRRTLLRMIRDEALGDGNRDYDFHRQLRNIPIIPCNDDAFRRPTEVYHPDAALAEVFPGGWPRPDVDDDADWPRFFDLLDLPKRPRAEDLVIEAQRIAAGPDTGIHREQAMAILATIDESWGKASQRDAEILHSLKELAWLPSQNRPGWYRPVDLFPASFLSRAGSQVAVLAAGRQLSTELSQFLDMPTTVPHHVVIAHLCHLSRTGTAPDPAIYRHLDQQYVRREAAAELKGLRNQAVIYHDRTHRWYPPAHTYFVDIADDLGERRISLSERTYDSLFRLMGVRDQIDPIPDAIAILQEIAGDVADRHIENPIPDADVKAVLRAHRLLMQALSGQNELHLTRELSDLRDIPCVLDQDRRLRRADEVFIHDQPHIADRFPGILLPDALKLQEVIVAHEQFLVALGVHRLSKVLRRNVVDAIKLERDAEWALLLKLLAQPLDRIAAASEDRPSIPWNRIEVFKAQSLQVHYRLEIGSQVIDGSEEPVAAFYDASASRILLSARDSWNRNLFPLSRELANVIDPLRPQHVNSTILRVLELARDDQLGRVEDYLDGVQIPRLSGEAIDTKADEAERARSTTTIVASPILELDIDTRPASSAASLEEEVVAVEPSFSLTPVVVRPAATPLTSRPENDGHPTEPEPSQPDLPAERYIPSAITVPSANNQPPPANGQQGTQAEPAVDSRRDHTPPKAGPRFIGNDTPDTPRNRTNWGALRRRFPEDFAHQLDREQVQAAIVARQAAIAAEEVSVPSDATRDDVEVREARIILTGQGLVDGFLRLRTRAARALLRHEVNDVISVSTEQGDEFELQIDREKEVAFNYNDLPLWFATNMIPAGAVLRLERTSAGRYRLRGTPCPEREVDRLRILEREEDGHIRELTNQTRTVEWEIHEETYRTEIRLEDRSALFAQAVGKGTIFEILIELFTEAQGPLDEGWLDEKVNDIRAVSAVTVPWELHQALCFEPAGQGTWCFNPALLSAEEERQNRGGPDWAGKRAVGSPTSSNAIEQNQEKPTDIVLATVPASLSHGNGHAPTDTITPSSSLPATWTSPLAWARAFDNFESWLAGNDDAATLDLLRSPISRVYAEFQRLDRFAKERDRSARIEAEAHALAERETRSDAERLTRSLDALIAEHGVDAPSTPDLADLLTDLLRLWDTDPAVSALIENHVKELDAPTWDYVVRPALDETIDRFARDGSFDAAMQILDLDERQTGRDRAADRQRMDDRALAREYLAEYNESEPIQVQAAELLEVVRLDPDLDEARSRLSTLARRAAEAIHDEVRAILTTGKVDEALRAIADCRIQYATWTAAGEGAFVRQQHLDRAAEKVFLAAADQAQMAAASEEQFRAALTALITLREQLPPDHRRTPALVEREAGALLIMGMELDRRLHHDRALVAKLLAWEIGSTKLTTPSMHAEAAPRWYKIIANQAEKLELWDVVEAARRKGYVLVQDDQRHSWRKRRFAASDRMHAERREIKQRYHILRTQIESWPESDEFVRAIGRNNLQKLTAAESWDRFVV